MSAVEAVLGLGAALLAAPALVYALQCLAGSLLPDRDDDADGDLPAQTIVIVPAHDEEAGVGETVRGLVEAVAEGLEGRGEVLVVADNCQDETATRAREAGARVLTRDEPERRGKGFAIDHGVAAIGAAPPEVVVLVDADCRVTPASLRHLVLRAAATDRPVQADYILRPPPTPTPRSGISGLAVLVKNRVRPRGMRRLGLPCQLTGSGMAMRYTTLHEAPPAGEDIVEDMVLGVELALQGRAPTSTSRAEVWSELPADRGAATGQRRRWEHGHIATMLRYAPRLLLRGLAERSLHRFAMGLDLLVPPLALLVLATAAWAGTCAAALGTAPISWPLGLALGALGAVMLGTLVAWAAHGRRTLPLRHLLFVPLYVLWKVPLYLAFFLRRGQRSWNRTARD